MRIGLRLPQRLEVDLQHDLVEAARTAEAAGYSSLWTYERLLFPENPVQPYAYSDLHGRSNTQWPEIARQVADPLAILTAAAVVTEKVRLGVALLVAALHTPIQLAKELATIDQISGGRVIAGMGSGWSIDEFQATGATAADRGLLLDETLDVFDAVWGPDPVNFRSPRIIIDNAAVLPKPASKIPVMLGGVTPKAMERVADRADGWLPFLIKPGPAGAAELRASWVRIREVASAKGRDTSSMELVVVANVAFTDRPAGPDRRAFAGTFDQIMDHVQTAAEAGADELIVDLNLQDWFTSTQQMLETAVKIAEQAAA